MARPLVSRTVRTLALAAVGFAGVGCVSSDQYAALKLEKDRMAEQLVSAQRDASTNAAAAKSYHDQLDQLAQGGNASTAMIINLQKENGELSARVAELNAKYQEALNRPTNSVALPPELNNALTEFAQQNPELVDFDSARGIVKFKSDVTFNVGDASLTSKAAGVISSFSRILNSPAAAKYELLVAGHTDNQPVHNPNTIKNGNKDNWYLSSHRAISVGEALQKDGISASRIGVVGYGEYRPIASNGSAAGQQQNRRVEVLILPTTVHASSGEEKVAGYTEKGSKSKPKSGASKDASGVKTVPSINK